MWAMPRPILSARSVGLYCWAAAWAPGADREKLLRLGPDRLCLTVADLARGLREALTDGRDSGS